MISGISSRFSRGNTERGSIVIVFAMIITFVTYHMNMQVIFGILHLLGILMIFYGLTNKLWDRIPRNVAPFIYITLIIAAALARAHLSPTSEIPAVRDILSALGWRQTGFRSADYQPVLPWIFVFLFGTWVGQYIRENKFPKWFYEAKCPVFPVIGRNALMIYVLHQPVLYGVVTGIAYLMAGNSS